MDSSKNINKKSNNERTQSSSSIKNIKLNIFCLSFFHIDIINDEKKIFTLKAKNSEISSITPILTEKIPYYRNYCVIIHEISINKAIKNKNFNLNLILFNEQSEKSIELNEIKIKIDKDIIVMNELTVKPNYQHDLLTQLDPEFLEKNIDINKFLRKNEKFKYFLKAFNKRSYSEDCKENLAMQYLSTLKEKEEIFFGDLVNIFNIAFGRPIIVNFLDIFPKLDIVIDSNIENNEFENLLNYYLKEKDTFLSKNYEFFEKAKNDKTNNKKINNKNENVIIENYRNKLENFMTLYQVIYKDPKDVNKQKIMSLKNLFITLIENKYDALKIMKFFIYNFHPVYIIMTSEYTERFTIKPNFIQENIEVSFEEFEGSYELLLRNESEKDKYIFDLSLIFNYFVEHLKSVEQIIRLKNLYKIEKECYPNKYFDEKAKLIIHNLGIKGIKAGRKSNIYIINFIIDDEIYSKKDSNTQGLKTYDILKYLRIELMNDEFFEKYNKYEIYNFFSENYSKFIKSFTSIDKIKYFGLFFKLLPPKRHNKDTASYLVTWLTQHINTYDVEQCPTFEDEIEIFFSIVNDKSKNQIMNNFLNFLDSNLEKKKCIEIFISLINKYGQNLNPKGAETMINCILFKDEGNDEKENININNLYTFFDEVKPNKIIVNLFLNKIKKIAINENDFFFENNYKFNIFEKLLKSKDYSLIGKSDNKNCKYWSDTKHTCNSIVNNLKNLNYTYTQIKKFFNIVNHNNIISRITSIYKCLEVDDPQLKAKSIKTNYDDILNLWKARSKSIEKIKEFYSFSENKQKIIDELSSYIMKINNYSLQYLNSKEALDEFDKYSKDKNIADEVATLRDSTIFLNIFNDTKNRYSHDTNHVELAIDRFKNLKKLFVNDQKKIEIELNKNEEVKFLINVGYKNEKELDIQIDWLKEYFKIFKFDFKQFLIERIQSIVRNKSIISMISGILFLFDIYKDILDLTNQEDISLREKLESYQKQLTINKIISIEQIEEIKINIENQFDLNENSIKKFVRLLIGVNHYPESIKFIKDKKSDDVNNLIQFLLESENSRLTEADINDFIVVVKFFEDTIESIKGQYDIFSKFLKKIISSINENAELCSSLFNYIEKSGNIQTLFNDYLKNSEGCIKKIEKILNNSSFSIIKKTDDTYTLEGSFNDVKKNIGNSLYKSDTNEIFMADNYQYAFYNDIESLFQRIYISKIPQKYENCAEIFIKFFKNCRKLLNLFNDFYSKGYQENFQIDFEFKQEKLNCIYRKQHIDIDSLIKKFEALYSVLHQLLKSFLVNKEIMRFFYGRQLSYLYNNIIKKNYNKILDLFRATYGPIFEDCTLANLNVNLKDYVEFDKFLETLTLIYNFINKQFKFNKKKIENIFEFNKINLLEEDEKKITPDCEGKTPEQTNSKKEYKGIYFHISNKNQEMDALSLYVSMTNHFPINGTFLYCSKDLNLEEMKCFLLRFINCKDNVLFCMVNVNILNNNLRVKFISLIKKYAAQFDQKSNSCLVIIFSGNKNDDEIHKALMNIKNIKSFPEESFFNKEYDFYNFFKYNDYVVKSSSCGLGKSQLIKSKYPEQAGGKKKQKINYIYFPIGGKFTRKHLVDRLINLPDMTNLNEKFVIHLDITQTKEIELLKEFFFKLIILRKCEINESARYFGNNITIIIEIPNDFIDYINEIEILSKLKNENLENISVIESSNELMTVAKILNMNETNEIIKKQKPDLKKINLKLTQEQMSNMIMKYLKDMEIDNPNYYQINIFIKVLSDEFLKFYNCRGYSVETLTYNAVASRMSKENTLKLLNLRKFIILSLVKVTKLFLVGPYENLIKNQQLNQQIINEKNKEKEVVINEKLNIKIDSVSFDEIKPSLIVFNEDGDSCTIITTCSEKDDEFKDLERLYNSQNTELIGARYRSKSESNLNDNYRKLRKFRDLSRKEIFDNLLSFLNVTINDEEKKRILGTYVYTPDNFIKVVLILMRIRVRIPVILMGETGCGKTTLIEMASKLINKGKVQIRKMNIHAGINDQDIIKFMNDVEAGVRAEDSRMLKNKKEEFNSMPEEHKKLYLKKNSEDKIFLEYENEIKRRKIWIFFDEINTCNSMGLFIEMFCKNSMYGKPLDERYIFIAACNPYRAGKPNNLLNVLYKKNQKIKSLVYTVNPLPMSLLNFVFNFGSLKEKDEYTYIQSMIEGVTNEIFEKEEYKDILNKKNEFIKMETDCVQCCQQFMKKNNDVSIVSLREVNRFNIFFKFFSDYLTERKNSNKSLIEENDLIKYYQSKNNIEILTAAVNLSIFICYYLRIPDKNSKEELSQELDAKKYFNGGNFLQIPQMEQDYLLNNFEIPIGIAKNKNLKENIFLLFFCIINKIPVIICGKPGKSKTLSFEIIQDSMKGPSSRNEFCRNYPSLTAFKIQGSLNTTSDEILNIFKKSREYQQKNKDKLSVVFMDEMGLAEIGENNALKVMHAELEQEMNKVSFVGISNWFIDASKMNRVIYNVVQDEDKEDLIQTGKEIAKSYEKKEANFNSQKYETIILRLSEAYYKYISKKKEANDSNKFFHGSRDFYSLIKSIMLDIIKNKKILNEYYSKDEDEKCDKLLNEICLNHILRNFGGLEKSISEFKGYFFEGYEEMDNYINNKNYSYNFFKCIQDNINDNNSRYLLLINNGNLSQELLNYILEDIIESKKKLITQEKGKNDIDLFGGNNLEKKERFIKYYIGSKFKADMNNIIYSNEILNKIKIQMETDNILILKDLESVYPSLYELFNQSYIYLNNKKFVHLGESKSLSLVNNEFKAIVLVEQDKVEDQEPPFLNRFEKHIINFTFLLNDELIELSDEIYDTLKEINDIKNYEGNQEDKNYEKDKSIIEKKFQKYNNFITKEEIQGLVYLGSKQIGYTTQGTSEINTINQSLIKKFVIERITPLLPEELMILISKFGFKKKHYSYFQIIYQSFKDNYCSNFVNYLIKSKQEISIVYTFSSIYDDINMDNSSLLNYDKKHTKEINISTITSIDQMDKEISDFIFDFSAQDNKDNKDSKNLLIIKFREDDFNKLNNVYYLIDDYKSNTRNKNLNLNQKKIIFIVYLKKANKMKKYMSFLSNCSQILINNLNNPYENFSEVVIKTNKEIIQNQLFDINTMIGINIDNVVRYFNYKIYNLDESQINGYKRAFVHSVTNSEYIKNIIIQCISNLANNEEDFLIKLCKQEQSSKINELDNNFSYRLESHINEFIFENLRKIIIILEKEQIINSIITTDTNDKLCEIDLIKKYIYDFIDNINNPENKKFFWKNKNLNQKINMTILYDQKLPFLQKIFSNLFNYIQQNIVVKFLEKDTYFFTNRIKNEQQELNDYKKTMKKLDDNLKFEVYKYDIIRNILNCNNEELIINFFEDCFYAFIKKNDKFKHKFKELSQILNLLIQLRLKTRINNKLSLLFIDDETIHLHNSFIDLIREEWSSDKCDENEEEEEEVSKTEINKNSIYFNIFISVMNFLQSYSNEINIILELYYFLLEKNQPIYDDVITMITQKKISMEESKRNEYYNRINKISFFYILESLCKILKEKLYELISDKTDNYFDKKIEFFQSMQYLMQNILLLEKRFLLFSKEIFSLDIIMKINTQVQSKKKNHNFFYFTIESMKSFLSITDKSNLIQNLQEQNICLIKIFGENINEYSLLMNKILLNYYKSDNDTKSRENIVKEILLQDKLPFHKELTEYCYPLIKKIFNFASFDIPLNGDNKKLLSYFDGSDILKKCINDKNDMQINDILFYRFELVCNKYFKKILNSKKEEKIKYQELCGSASKKYLKDAIECYYNKSNVKNNSLNAIYKLYSLAYIKIYLKYYIDLLLDNKAYQQFTERNEVNNLLLGSEVKQKNVVNFYILKLLYKRKMNWENFVNYYNSVINENDDKFGFYETKNILKLEQNESFIKVPFLLHGFKIRENLEYSQFLSGLDYNGLNKTIFEKVFIALKRYNYLYSFLSNNSILYYSYRDNNEYKAKKDNSMNLIINSLKHLNDEKKIDKDIMNFFNTFFDQKFLYDKVFPKMDLNDLETPDEEKLNKIKILYYSLIFVISVLISSKNKEKTKIEYLYQNLITKNISSYIDSYYLPGNFQYTNIRIQSFYEIKEILKKNPKKLGTYLCPCGQYYILDKCTYPRKEFSCTRCHQTVGGLKFNMVKKEGHVRVFLSEENREEIMKKHRDAYIPYILLDNFEKDINELKKKVNKGIEVNTQNISRDSFLLKDEFVRDMNDITYRLLNFVLYSFIFYGNIMGYIKDKTLGDKYVINSMTCFSILEKNWEIMQSILDKVPVELFINLIFDEINEKLISCKKLNNEEEQIKFEKEINNIIINKYKDNNLIKNLKLLNDSVTNLKPLSNKAIIQEVFPYTNYSKEDFPDFKYFYLFEFPTQEHFIFNFNTKQKFKDKYPILNSIINGDKIKEHIKLMKYLPEINKICNYMINFVSFKYSREEAKKALIKEEIKDEEIINLINEFINIYKIIRPKITQEGCHEFGELYKEIDKDKVVLSDLCVDSGEMGFGLVLLAMYKDMSSWQNSFIDEIINSENIQLKNYKYLFNSKIMIQDCSSEQILDLPSFDDEIVLRDDKNCTLFEMIISNSHRKENYVIYNYDEIEDELASYILPKIKRFKTEIRKVEYQYEIFIGEKSSLIINFKEKYQQRNLTEVELNSIINYIIVNQNNKKINLINFLFSLQVFIDKILDEVPSPDESLFSLLNKKDNDNIPFIDLDKKFFDDVLNNIKKIQNEENNFNNNNNNNKYLTVNCLINLYEIVEFFCWENIKKNLDKKYCEDIDDNIKMQFDIILAPNQQEDKEDKNNPIIITKLDLCSAIRKFLSRYLSGKSEENINPNNKLKNYMINEEFWPSDFADIDIEENINSIFGDLNIFVSHSLKIYDYLGGDIQKLDEIKIKYMENAENNKNLKKIDNLKDNINVTIPERRENLNEIIEDNNQEEINENMVIEGNINDIDYQENNGENIEGDNGDDDNNNSEISY